jgi:hypothetical protein
MSEPSSIAHQALEDLWKKKKLPERWLKIITASRSVNKHLSTDEWASVLKLKPPIEKCLFSNLKSYKKGSQYTAQCLWWNDNKVNLACHRIAALVFLDEDELCDPRVVERVIHSDHLEVNWHASHWYCHNEGCINPMHLIPESNGTNQERNTCKRHRETINYNCPHVPTCVNCKPCSGEVAVPKKWKRSKIN